MGGLVLVDACGRRQEGRENGERNGRALRSHGKDYPKLGLIEFCAKGDATAGCNRARQLDPGSLGVGDQLQNLRAVREGTRAKLRDGTRIWIITEADPSVTTILLPEEY